MSLRLPTCVLSAWDTLVFKDNWAHCSGSVLKHTVIVHLITMSLFFHMDSASSYVFYVTINMK